jgi:ferritin-like metal-binding protein YciE
MGWFTKDIKTMDDLFVHTLQDMYYAENQIVKALPTMIAKADNPLLKDGLTQHLAQTHEQVKRLEAIFRLQGVETAGIACPAIDGILEEADVISSDVADKQVLDAALIAAAQAVEHYEMTRYGTLVSWARELGHDDCATLLQTTLDEEKTTDRKLSSLAEAGLNMRAVNAQQRQSPA